MSAAVADLSIIIVNYNGQFWLKTTLNSLKAEYLAKTKRKVDVIVVDNGSSDDSVQFLEKQYKWVKVIALKENLGFSAGNNVGLKQAKGRYVMLLNSDVEFTSDSNLDVLLDYLDANKQVAVVTPKLVLSTGELDWACHRGEPTLWAAFTYFTGLSKLSPASKWLGQYHQTYQDLTQVHEIEACSGAAMIVRQTAIAKVGLLDERFFFYAEDLDWCHRFRAQGFQIIFHPEVVLIHHKYKSGMSSNSDSVRRKTRDYFYDTMSQYYDKHYRQQYPEWVRWLVNAVITIKKGGI